VAKFKKKPVEIEAHRVTAYKDDPESLQKLASWCGGKLYTNVDNPYITIKTLEGEMLALEGDWVIKGVAGEFYPCKNDIFVLSYEQTDW
jgi:hypothetical protein